QQNTYVQPLLHEPPVVYGNLPQYYQQQQQQHIMQYPPHNVVYGPPPTQIYYNQNEMMVKSSSSSISSSNNSPRTPPPRLHSSSPPRLVTPLTPPPSTEDRVKETIARANAIPAEFYQTEFLEYSKKSYDGRKRKRTDSNNDEPCKKLNQGEDAGDPEEILSTNEMRRQIHIQSEQKRRAQIKDGFDILKSHLPGCSNKKLSKAALLTRTVQQLEHMKKMQAELLAEVERLAEENTSLKMMQH
ncbi:hypothetical protein INT47_001644, partial [Mucor saturninus]